MRNGRWALAVILATALLAGAESRRPFAAQQRAKGPATPMDRIAEGYVKLVLAMGAHDADYVDAYYGPSEWKTEAAAAKPGLDAIATRAATLLGELGRTPSGTDEMVTLRRQYLERQLSALAARVRILKGERLTFDQESKALYDAVAPTYPDTHFQQILAKLAQRFPGKGPLVTRYEAFRRQFVIPPAKLDAVFKLAIQACRERTAAHVKLPAGEQFTVEYVKNKSWSGYNWYQGGFRSLIQVNTDLPIYIDRAVDLACHEGYPGHHVYNALLETHLVKERGWIEFSVYPLFSPQSLIAEGTANFGIDVAFPGIRTVRIGVPRGGLEHVEVARRTRRTQAAVNVVCEHHGSGHARSLAPGALATQLNARVLPPSTAMLTPFT